MAHCLATRPNPNPGSLSTLTFLGRPSEPTVTTRSTFSELICSMSASAGKPQFQLPSAGRAARDRSLPAGGAGGVGTVPVAFGTPVAVAACPTYLVEVPLLEVWPPGNLSASPET